MKVIAEQKGEGVSVWEEEAGEGGRSRDMMGRGGRLVLERMRNM